MLNCRLKSVQVHCVDVKKCLLKYSNDFIVKICLDPFGCYLCFMYSMYSPQGKVFSSIQPQANINDVCIYLNSGRNNLNNNLRLDKLNCVAEVGKAQGEIYMIEHLLYTDESSKYKGRL